MNTALALCEDDLTNTYYAQLSPIDDGYVNSVNPTTVYKDTQLMIVSTASAYIKFDISSLMGKNIISAKLRISLGDVSQYAFDLNKVDSNSWDDDTLCYNNRPLMGDLISRQTINPQAIWTEIDVTDWVKERQEDNVSYVSLGMDNQVSYLKLASNRYTLFPSARPYLVVQYDDPIVAVDLHSTTYDYANVTDVDTLNNYFYKIQDVLSAKYFAKL